MLLPFVTALLASAAPTATQPPAGSASVLEADENWIAVPDETLVYLDVAGKRVVMQLLPDLAPQNVDLISKLLDDGAFDGGTINRVQENYVVQWGEKPDHDRGDLPDTAPAEFDHERGSGITTIPFGDSYAPQVGFHGQAYAAQDGERWWPIHCYGMVGAGRDMAADSATGGELYVVTGQAPRHLDRNITLVGRVIWGMENLTSLPRGTGALGFYETDKEKVPITMRAATSVPLADRIELETIPTGSSAFAQWVDARANRARDGWFLYSHGAIDICNVPIPVREAD
ncbi:MAG: peptidylprolyl isomerase [Pacificimonas sp.]